MVFPHPKLYRTLALLCLLFLVGCIPAAPAQPRAPETAVSQGSTPLVPSPTLGQPTVTQAPALTPTPKPAVRLSDAEISAAIQAVLDKRTAALRARDKAAFDATIDQSNNRAFRRIQNEDWENGRAFSYSGGKVTQIQHTKDPEGYVKARVEFGSTLAFWTFKQGDDGVWRMTEPTLTELGSRRSKEYTHFIVLHYAYDAALVDRHAVVAEKVYPVITGKMKREPAKKIRLIMSPTVESMPGLAKRETLAFYTAGERDALYIRSLESYLGGTVRGGASDDQYLGNTIEHELTHLVHDTIVPIVKVPSWMSEGLAQFNCECWYGSLRGVIAANTAWTLTQLDKADHFDRLRGNDSTASPEDIRLAYDVSRTLVEYINQKYSIEKFWELNNEFATSRNMPASYKKVFGIEYADFEAQWLAWMKQTYGR